MPTPNEPTGPKPSKQRRAQRNAEQVDLIRRYASNDPVVHEQARIEVVAIWQSALDSIMKEPDPFKRAAPPSDLSRRPT